MRRLTLLVLVLLPLWACSSDDSASDGADPEEFCELLAAEANTADPGTPEGQAYMDDLQRTVPDEIEDDVSTMLEMFEAFVAIPEDDPEGGVQAAALMSDPEVLSAVDAIDAYAVSECGLPAGTISGQTGVEGPPLTANP